MQAGNQNISGKRGYYTPGPNGGPTERADYKKIKIPYKERKGVTWPNGARLALSWYIAAEYWEENIGPIVGGSGRNTAALDERELDWVTLSSRTWYNFECGIFRSMDVFEKHGVKVSGLISGLAAQYYPEVIKELAQRGHEIAAHEWDQSVGSWNMTREQERDSVRRTTQNIERASGVRPVGWINPAARPTPDTLEFIADENYLWHGDLRDDDLPYGIRYKGKTLVRIPHCNVTHNDFSYWGFGGVGEMKLSPHKAFEYLKDVIDANLEWSKNEPIMMQLGNHPFVGAHPDRMLTLDRILAYAKSLPGVWICTYKDIAEYWKKTYLA